jgi:uncharacterized protein (TIGR03435 family)
MKRLTVILGLAVIAIAPPRARSQTPPAAGLSFEVASIKPIDSRPTSPGDIQLGCRGTDSHSPGMTIPVGRCIARFEPLRLVIALAYDVPPSMLYPYEGAVVSGGPDWVKTPTYMIEAKAEAPATLAELRMMLQTLLTDRFKLKVHREMRQMPVYSLTRGKGELKFTPAPTDRDCGEQVRRDHQFELGASSLAGQCHGFVPDKGALTGRSVDMSDFAEMLGIWAGRVVIDKTGIEGLFDIKMPPMTSANVQAAPPREGGSGQVGDPKILGEPLPTVFAAVEQIGLKLESTKGPVEVIVIDSIEKPSEN